MLSSAWSFQYKLTRLELILFAGQLLDAPIPGVFSRHGRRNRRSAVSDSSKLWPKGVIPYTLESAISGELLVALGYEESSEIKMKLSN